MKDVLSQSEIDSLINAMSSGEIKEVEVEVKKEKKVKDYDFKRPNKLSKDHIYSIRNMYENYARIAANTLANQIRANVEMSVGSVEQVTFGEFIGSIPNPTIFAIFTLNPLEGYCVLEVNQSFGFHMIDLLFGGSKLSELTSREFTDIEARVIKEVIADLVKTSKAAWDDILEVEPQLLTVESNPQMNQTLSYNESGVLITLKVEIEEESLLINMCMPHNIFEKVQDEIKLRSIDKNKNKKHKKEYKQVIEKKLHDTELEMKIILGKTEISVEEFVDLTIGDVIQLETRIDEPLEMQVEEKSRFTVRPGVFNSKISGQVVDYNRKDLMENE